ncbi:MAG: DUF4145 domain-containing protein [Proteobacteria bacterium]|nr:DUF4145 domain-containing protein [Bacteroidota bacterium]MBU1541880.1 DUF4145 domain-containing protein [Pseudomonadota bacterium]
MEHIVKIIEVIVWPVVVLASVYLLRKPLIELIPQLKKLKYKELEMEFEHELEALSKKSQESRSRVEIEVPKEEEEDYYLQRVKELSPIAAIMESWLGLETTAISTAQHFKLTPEKKRINFHIAIQTLHKNNVLTDQDVANINDLRALRNKAAHELNFQITEDEAAKFIEIARDQSDIIAGETWRKFGGCTH